MAIRVRIDEGCQTQHQLLWDTVWNAEQGFGDWAVAAPGTPGNSGGLQADNALHTAIVLCLFTDRRCPPDHPLAKNIQDGDPRGYWGDGVDVRADLGETELGSLLWLLENTAIDPVDTPRWLQSLALDALAVLVGQGAVVRVDAQASIDSTRNRGDLAVQLYGADGARIYDRKFQALWAQIGKG